MSLISEALNKNRKGAKVPQKQVLHEDGTDKAKTLACNGGKGVKESKKSFLSGSTLRIFLDGATAFCRGRTGIRKGKPSVLSISILGTLLAGAIALYYVVNFTNLLPQLSSRGNFKISIKDDINPALPAEVSKETAPVPTKSIQDTAKTESQPVEKLVATNKDIVVALPQVQTNDPIEPVPLSLTDVTQPSRDGEEQVQWTYVSVPVELQTVESSEAERAKSTFEEPAVNPLGEAGQGSQISPESTSDEQSNDEWYTAYHFGMGVFHQKNKEIGKAIEEYSKVVELDPNNAEVHINLGVIYKDKGDWDKAVEEYGKALAIDPWLDVGYNNLGVVYYLQGNYAEAIRHYQKAVEINPNNLESYVNIGIAYGIQGRTDEAMRAFQTAISINPQHAETQYNLAVIYDENDAFEDALLYYSKFLESNPATKSELIDKVQKRIVVLLSKLKVENMTVQ